MKINKNFLVHIVLGHSYLVYFASLLVGLVIDLHWKYHFNLPVLVPVGFVLLFVGPAFIYWAQHTSHQLAVKQVITEKTTETHDFYRGPYTFTRSPTHLGLFLMIIGVGFIFNSVAIVLTTLLAYIVTKTFFLPKEEDLLIEKYGSEYEKYKEKVIL